MLSRTNIWVKVRNGRHVARFKYTDATGVLREITRSGKSHREAKTKARKAWDDIVSKQNSQSFVESTDQPSNANNSVKNSQMTFNQYADLYVEKYFFQATYNELGKKINRGLEKSTIKRNESVMKHLRKVFGDQQLSSISFEQIETYKENRLKIIKIDSVIRELVILKQMLKQAKRRKYIDHDPWDDDDPQCRIINHDAKTKRTRRLHPDEEVRLLISCLQIALPVTTTIQLYIFCIWALDTAMRHQEILKTVWKNVDLEKCEIYVPWQITKVKRSKVVPISERMKKYLLIWKRWQNSKEDEHVLDLKNMYAYFILVRNKAGLKDIIIHDLRRTSISRGVENGVPEFVVAKIAGHSVKAFETMVASLSQTFDYFTPGTTSLSQFKDTIDELNAEMERSSPEIVELLEQRFGEENIAAS